MEKAGTAAHFSVNFIEKCRGRPYHATPCYVKDEARL
jgi:hypothetical protein